MVAVDFGSLLKTAKKTITSSGGNDQVANTAALQVDKVNTVIAESNNEILPTLTKQDDVQVVLDREEARLRDRKQAIDAAAVGQDRLIDLTRNATQRSRAINNMYIVGVVGLLLYLGVRLTTGFLPELVTDILTILIFSITVLWILKMYATYVNRNNMDFDMINLGEPSKMVGNASGKAGGSGATSSGAGLIESRIGGGCVKDACCPDGTKYNEKYAICVPNSAPYNVVSGKTPEEAALYRYFMPDKQWKSTASCATGETYSFDELGCKKPSESFTTIRTSDMAKANEPFEFSEYNLYK
jgi:type II secretory pathway pseudopilin PulG